MKIELLEILGDGAFADVWKAKDELDRYVAVKIVRPAQIGVANALAHARALARAKHENVVSVLTLERIPDPQTDEDVDCVVMELIEGDTLGSLFNKVVFARERVLRVGIGLIQGLAHIHAQGMAHGDLHEDNVMVTGDVAKVIDILYLNSLASLSTENRERRLRRDLLSLRIILQQLIVKSEMDQAEATEFNNLLEADAGTEEIEAALRQICSSDADDINRMIEHAYARIVEDSFIPGDEYAQALSEETPQQIIVPLLQKFITEKDYDPKHREFLLALWERLDDDEKNEVARTLGVELDKAVPNGKWASCIRMLRDLRADGWTRLTTRLRLKIEGAIVRDVLAGSKDIHGTKTLNGGVLGTYACGPLSRHFTKPEILADNLISLLRQNWYTQNYVAEFFLPRIPDIALTTGKRAEFVKALRSAISNDAKLIKRGIEDLPNDWIAELKNNE